VLLNLGSERSWQLRQLGSGQSTQLELASVGGGGKKNLIINTGGRVGIGTTTPKATLDVNGSVRVADDVVLANADCAEEFDIDPASRSEPGTVLVIGPERQLQHCSQPYDRRVVGIVSGAGNQRPGIILGRQEHAGNATRVPLALTGTVLCNVDTTVSPIAVGDLLTSSATPGHAMAATDAAKSFGSIIGKALEGYTSGIGMIPVLVALQ
jgi:hypothetical protein